MPDTYPAASLETAACLWEAVLELRDSKSLSDTAAAARCADIRAAFGRIGTSGTRLTVLGWTDLVDRAWAQARDHYDAPFDWEFVPDWIIANIDWSAEYPTVRETPLAFDPSPAPPGYDLDIPLMLSAVVMTHDGETAVNAAARALLSRIEGANDCLSGDRYGVPAITEFSIVASGDAFDITPISEEPLP
jgi:hypothetical protein